MQTHRYVETSLRFCSLLVVVLMVCAWPATAYAQNATPPRIVDTVYFPGFKPLDMAVFETGNKVFVLDGNSPNIFVIDGLSHTIVDTISVGAGLDMLLNETHQKLYVSRPNDVGVIDAQTHTIVKTLNQAGLRLRVHDETRDRIYATTSFAAGEIWRIDAADDSLVMVADQGIDLFGDVDMNETANELVVSSVQFNELRVIDGETFEKQVISLDDLGFPLPQAYHIRVNERENKAYMLSGTLLNLLIVDLDTEEKKYLGRARFGYGTIVVDEALNKVVTSGQDYSAIVDGAEDTYIHVGSSGAGDNSRKGSALHRSTHHVFMAADTTIDILDLETRQTMRLSYTPPFTEERNLVRYKTVVNQTTGVVYYLFSESLNDNGLLVVMEDGEIVDNWTAQMGSLYPPSEQPRIIRGIWFNDALLGWAVGGDDDVGVIITTSDGGVTWNVQHNVDGFDFYDVHFTDQHTGWAVGGNYPFGSRAGFLVKTTDGGANWQSRPSPVAGGLTAVFFRDSRHGWIGGNESSTGQIYQTVDGGETWSLLFTLPPAYSVEDIFFVDAQTGWVASSGRGGSVFRTTDGGRNWEESDLVTGFINGVFFLDQNVGWAVGEHVFSPMGGVIFYTTDGGETWEQQVEGLRRMSGFFQGADGVHDIFFVDALRGWAVTELGQILKTTDGGQNWLIQWEDVGSTEPKLYAVHLTSANAGWAGGSGIGSVALRYHNTLPLPAYPTNLMATPASNTSIALTWTDRADNEEGFTIFRSDAFSGAYKQIASVVPNTTRFTDTELDPDTTYWYRVAAFNAWGASARSRESHAAASTGVTLAQGEGRVPAAYYLETNYPNPFNRATSIRFGLPQADHVTLKLYTIAGAEVATLVDETLAPGRYAVAWDASGRASGVYVYRMQTGRFFDTKTMVLVK